jgi:uncharacterized protein (DUF1499 family)
VNLLAAMMGRGAQGLPAPAPLEFASLVLPRSPNTCLAAPAGTAGAHVTTPPYALGADALFAALRAVGDGAPRTTRLAAWPERRQAQWVERSALMNYPDIIVAEVQPGPGGAALWLYSRSLVGWSDLGVNAKRVARWLAALDAQLAATPAAPPAAALAAALAERAAGAHVLVLGEDVEMAPALVLAAAAAGAASARALSPERPADADARLAAAAHRAGLAPVAAGLLEAARVGAANTPPAAFADSEAPALWWLREHLEAPDLAARTGPLDLVVEPVGLETRPEPARRLAALRATGARRLLLRSAALPEGCTQGFEAATLWHAGTLDAVRAAALDAALRQHGLALPQFEALPGRLTAEAAAAAGLAAPWWWFMGEAALLTLLAEAGWEGEVLAREGPFVVVAARAA